MSQKGTSKSSSSKSSSSSSKSSSSSSTQRATLKSSPSTGGFQTAPGFTGSSSTSGGGGGGGRSMSMNVTPGKSNTYSATQANDNTVKLYDHQLIMNEQQKLMRELQITPSQALNMALLNSTSPLKAVGGTAYDPMTKKNVAVNGTQLQNMQAAQKSLRAMGYTPYQAREMSFAYKDSNPMSAVNSNVNNPKTIAINSIRVPLPKAPTITTETSSPAVLPSKIVSSYDEPTNTDNNQVTYNSPLSVNQMTDNYLNAGKGNIMTSEDQVPAQSRGSIKTL